MAVQIGPFALPPGENCDYGVRACRVLGASLNTCDDTHAPPYFTCSADPLRGPDAYPEQERPLPWLWIGLGVGLGAVALMVARKR